MKTRMAIWFVGLLATAPVPALAQGIAVHDNANLLQHIQAVRQALQIVAQGKQQIAEAQRLYQDLNKLTDIPRLAEELRTDALRQLDTSSSSLPGFASGNLDVVGAARGKADAVYRGLLAQLGVGGSEQSRAAFDLKARSVGVQVALADSIGSAVTSRAQGLETLRNRLGSAGTSKEVADLTARLQLETAAMQNDQLRLQAIAFQQQAQERQRAAAGQAALSQKMEAASRYYKGQQ